MHILLSVPIRETLVGFGGGGVGGVVGGVGPSSVPVSAEGVLTVRGALPLRRRKAHFRLRLGVRV